MDLWREYVYAQPVWCERQYEKYPPVPVDINAFWRPALQHCPNQHCHPLAQRTLSAAIFDLYVEVGELNGQRFVVSWVIARVLPQDGNKSELWNMLLAETKMKNRSY